MSIISSARFMRALATTNIKSALALRGAAWLQITFMLINNLAFFAIWYIIFDRFEEIRGWRIEQMTALYGISAGSFGLAMVFGGGARYLAQTIREAGLDGWLTQPRSVLAQVSMSRSVTSGWGDVLTAALFLGLSGIAGGANIPLCIVLMFAGALIFVSTNIIFNSSAFWFGDTADISRQLGDFLIVFSTAPFPIFDGWLRVLLFTAIPSAFVGYLPVTLLGKFDPWLLAAVLGASLFYLLLASFIFGRGLKRYASGNMVGLKLT